MNHPMWRVVWWVIGGLVAVTVGSAFATIYLGQAGALGVIVAVAGIFGGKIPAEYRKARAQAASHPSSS